MAIVNKKEFKIQKDGKEVTLAAIRPNQTIKQRAEIEYAKAWGSYVQEKGLILETALWDSLKKKNLWDEDKQKELDEVDKQLNECEDMLPDEKGKVKQKGVTLSKAREAAIKMRINRIRRVNLLKDFTELKSHTVEGLSDNARFNYLVSQCIVHADTKKPYFENLQAYLDKADELDSVQSAREFAQLYYNFDPDFDKNLPENRFLLKYKMCRDGDLSLVDKQGNLVDILGNKVNEDGSPIGEVVVKEDFDVEDDWNDPKPEVEVVEPVVVPEPTEELGNREA